MCAVKSQPLLTWEPLMVTVLEKGRRFLLPSSDAISLQGPIWCINPVTHELLDYVVCNQISLFITTFSKIFYLILLEFHTFILLIFIQHFSPQLFPNPLSSPCVSPTSCLFFFLKSKEKKFYLVKANIQKRSDGKVLWQGNLGGATERSHTEQGTGSRSGNVLSHSAPSEQALHSWYNRCGPGDLPPASLFLPLSSSLPVCQGHARFQHP